MTKEKKVVFSEEIDSSISGFSLGITLVLVAIFVYYTELFHNKIIEIIITILLVFIGMIGTFLEIGKAKSDNIQGINDFGLGTIFSAGAVFFVFKYNKIPLNIICFIVLLISVYGAIQGLFRILYSLKIEKEKHLTRRLVLLKLLWVLQR